jgi:hypothetical protein
MLLGSEFEFTSVRRNTALFSLNFVASNKMAYFEKWLNYVTLRNSNHEICTFGSIFRYTVPSEAGECHEVQLQSSGILRRVGKIRQSNRHRGETILLPVIVRAYMGVKLSL